MRTGRILGAVVVVGGLAFGFLGGEYGTFDWWQLKRDIAREQAALNRLYVVIDSLEQVADALESDSAAQERAARERFGMVRPGELLFRVEPVAP